MNTFAKIKQKRIENNKNYNKFQVKFETFFWCYFRINSRNIYQLLQTETIDRLIGKYRKINKLSQSLFKSYVSPNTHKIYIIQNIANKKQVQH